MELRTRDMSTGQSAVWDDLTTTDVRESRDWILLKSLDEALQGLETTYGTAEATLVTNPGGDIRLEAGQLLVVMGSKEQLQRFAEVLGPALESTDPMAE